MTRPTDKECVEIACRALDSIATMSPAGDMLADDDDPSQCGQCDRSMQLREDAARDEVQICDACAQDLVVRMGDTAHRALRAMRGKVDPT